MTTVAGCTVCEMLTSRPPPGGFVYEDDHFVVAIAHTTPVPGWLIVYLRRHEVPLTSRLTDREAEALGPVVRRLVRVIVDCVGAERVYNTLFGEGAQHWHMLLAARKPDIPAADRQVDLIRNASRYVDLEAAVEVAAAMRRALTTRAE